MLNDAITIRRLEAAEVEDYRTIRLAALTTSPEAFGSVYAIEVAKPLEKHAERLATSVAFGAYSGGRIVGLAGFTQEEGLKDSHKGFIWGFFVDPAHRGRGIGAALMTALLTAARTQVEQLMLTVVQDNRPAIALYERFGFTPYGIEPRALKTDSGYVDELLMALIL